MAPSRALALATGFLIACGGSSSDSVTSGGTPDGGTTVPVSAKSLPCDVDRVLAANCRSCHGDPASFGAPMPLVTYADLQAATTQTRGKKVYEVVGTRVSDAINPMPPVPNARLSAADEKVLVDWAAVGAPSGSGNCTGTTPTPTPNPTTKCTANLDLAPASAWSMPQDTADEYVCWGVDLTRPDPTHIVGFAPKIDNAKIVHHVVLYESPTSVSGTPARCPSGGSVLWRMLYGWAPGVQGLDLPPEAGFPIATTGATHYVVQMHYSNVQRLSGEKDSTKLSVCTSAPRPNEADVVAFGTQNISLTPAPGVQRRTCSLTLPSAMSGLHFFTAMPHMHKLGVEMSTVLKPKAGGANVDLGTMTTFDFNTQTWLPVTATSATGDVVTTTCGWNNNSGGTVSFGERTSDEMCYSFTMYWPKVQSSLFSWVTPSILSRCE